MGIPQISRTNISWTCMKARGDIGEILLSPDHVSLSGSLVIEKRYKEKDRGWPKCV